MDCVYKALAHCTGRTVEDLKAELNPQVTLPDGMPMPPSLHDLIDYFMFIGGSLTPIEKIPYSTHKGKKTTEGSLETAAVRWRLYLEQYEGFLVGPGANGVGHMCYVNGGTVHDGDERYTYRECDKNGFHPHTFWVLTWQA